MYRVAEQKGRGYIILRKSDRKKMNKGYFASSKIAKEEMNNLITENAVKEKSAYLFVDAFSLWISEREAVSANADAALTKGAIEPYINDLKLRIKPYMPNIALSEFTYPVMKKFLLDCSNAGYKFKRLQRTVRNIKTFLNHMAKEGKKPCLDMLKFKIEDVEAIVPADYEQRFEKETQVIDETSVGDMLTKLNANKDEDFKSALTFAIFVMMFLFGLRRSEIKGLKPQHINIDEGYVSIKGIYINGEGGYLRRTKNRGSFRDIDIDEKSAAFFKWWFSVLKKYRPHTLWLFPTIKNTGAPISDKGLSNILWSTYAANGLAKIEWKSGHVIVIDSPFKGAPMKTWRHRLATLLVDNMAFDKNLTTNFVKARIGHTKFTTTQDIYGNHNRKATAATTASVAKLIGTSKIL